MQYLVKKELGQDDALQLKKRVSITQLTIDAQAEMVSVVYAIETLSPTGVVVQTSDQKEYTRYNRAEYVDGNGNTIPANMKFNDLKASPLGQGILALLQSDIDGYPDLKQK